MSDKGCVCHISAFFMALSNCMVCVWQGWLKPIRSLRDRSPCCFSPRERRRARLGKRAHPEKTNNGKAKWEVSFRKAPLRLFIFRVETRSGTVTGKSLPVTRKRLKHGVRWSLTLASFARYFSLLFFVPLPPSAASLCLGMRGMIGDGFSGCKFVNFVNFLEKCKPKSPSPTIFPIRQGVFKVFLRFLTSFEEFPRAP